MSPKQLRSIARSTKRVNLWHGSIRSGKTVASLLAFLMYVANAPRGGVLVVVGRTRESIARNVFEPLMDPDLFGPLAKMVSYTAGAPTAKIMGRTIHVLGAGDARAEATLRGLTVAGAYVDELTLVSLSFWNQLLGRMSVPGARAFATTNPDGPAHWVKRGLIDRAKKLDYYTVSFALEDNEWLCRNNPEYVAQIKREHTGLWYDRFILGLWTVAEGVVFTGWRPERHVMPHADLPPMDRLLATGVDHGTTNRSRGYLLGMATVDSVTRLYAVDEWAPPLGLSDAKQVNHYLEWLGDRTPEWEFVDPAATSLRKAFFDVDRTTGKAKNEVLPGIQSVAGLLDADRLVVSDRCSDLIKYLPGYVWDKKASDKGEDKVVKIDDHEVDALRYAVHSTRFLWTDHVPLSGPDPAELTEAEAA